MASLFLSKKIIIPAIMFFGGLLIALGILILANFTAAQLSVASQFPQWTQSAGEGISVPACGSSAVDYPSVTCSGGNPVVTIGWVGDDFGTGGYDVDVRITPGMSGVDTPDAPYYSPGTTGTFTWNGASNNTAYTYSVWLQDNGDGLGSYNHFIIASGYLRFTSEFGNVSDGFFDPFPSMVKATAWDVTGNVNSNFTRIDWSNDTVWTRPPPSIATIAGDWFYNGLPTSIVQLTDGSFTTPNCALPPGDFSLSLGGSVACNSVPLSWTASAGAEAYRIFRGSPRVDISPYQPYTALNFTDTAVSPNTSYLYQIEAYNIGGTNRSNALNVDTPNCPPTLNFSADPTSVLQGQSSTLSWTTTNTYPGNSCTASDAWSGDKAGSGGSEVVFPSPPPSVTYTMTCTGPGGSIGPQSVTVNITPLALPDWREIIPR